MLTVQRVVTLCPASRAAVWSSWAASTWLSVCFLLLVDRRCLRALGSAPVRPKLAEMCLATSDSQMRTKRLRPYLKSSLAFHTVASACGVESTTGVLKRDSWRVHTTFSPQKTSHMPQFGQDLHPKKKVIIEFEAFAGSYMNGFNPHSCSYALSSFSRSAKIGRTAIQVAQDVVVIEKAILAATLCRLQGVRAPPPGGADIWDLSVAQLQQAATYEEAESPHGSAATALVQALMGALMAVGKSCGGRERARCAAVKLKQRTKKAASLNDVAAAGLGRREACKDAPLPRKGRAKNYIGYGEQGHNEDSGKAPAAVRPVAARTPPSTAAAAELKCPNGVGGLYKGGDEARLAQQHCGGAQSAYERGGDPLVRDPLWSTWRQTRACTVRVSVLASVIFDEDTDDTNTRAEVITALQKELEDLSLLRP